MTRNKAKRKQKVPLPTQPIFLFTPFAMATKRTREDEEEDDDVVVAVATAKPTLSEAALRVHSLCAELEVLCCMMGTPKDTVLGLARDLGAALPDASHLVDSLTPGSPDEGLGAAYGRLHEDGNAALREVVKALWDRYSAVDCLTRWITDAMSTWVLRLSSLPREWDEPHSFRGPEVGLSPGSDECEPCIKALRLTRNEGTAIAAEECESAHALLRALTKVTWWTCVWGAGSCFTAPTEACLTSTYVALLTLLSNFSRAATALWGGAVVATDLLAVTPLARALMATGHVVRALNCDGRWDAQCNVHGQHTALTLALVGKAVAALLRLLPAAGFPSKPSFSMEKYEEEHGPLPADVCDTLAAIERFEPLVTFGPEVGDKLPLDAGQQCNFARIILKRIREFTPVPRVAPVAE